MLSSELIRLIQEADPTGNKHCCVNNRDIIDVSSQPAYWDGVQEILITDSNSNSVTKGILNGDGTKIQITTYELGEAVFNNPKLPVEYNVSAHHRPSIDKWRKEGLLPSISESERYTVALNTPIENEKFYSTLTGYQFYVVNMLDKHPFINTEDSPLITVQNNKGKLHFCNILDDEDYYTDLFFDKFIFNISRNQFKSKKVNILDYCKISNYALYFYKYNIDGSTILIYNDSNTYAVNYDLQESLSILKSFLRKHEYAIIQKTLFEEA